MSYLMRDAWWGRFIECVAIILSNSEIVNKTLAVKQISWWYFNVLIITLDWNHNNYDKVAYINLLFTEIMWKNIYHI